MNKKIPALMALMLSLAVAGNAGAAETPDVSGDWYAGMYGIPVTLSLADETFTLNVLGESIDGTWEMTAGVRATAMLNLSHDYVMNGKLYWDPRVNVGYSLPRLSFFGKPTFIRIAAGIGQHTKMPTIEHLYPERLT